MKCGVVIHWYELGVQLLNSENSFYLDEISADFPNDHRKCCTKMFNKWLETTYGACWDQIHEALIEIGLEAAAAKVKKFYEGICTYSYIAINIGTLIHNYIAIVCFIHIVTGFARLPRTKTEIHLFIYY